MQPEDRFARQRRVAEIGDAGQARLLSAEVSLPATPSGDVARIYLERAGVGVKLDAGGEELESPHAHHFRHAATRELARGAWRALHEVRRILRLEGA